jgi:hypothetical protein
MLEAAKDQVFFQRFPEDMPPAQTLEITLSGVKSSMLDADGLMLVLPKQQINQPRNERFSKLEIDFGKKVKIREMHANLTTSEIICIGQIDSPIIVGNSHLSDARSTLTTYYARKNKNKILHAYFQLPGSHFLGIEKVLATYDQIFCIDTNSAIARDGRKVAVTTAIIGKPQTLAGSAMYIGETTEYQCVAYDPPGNPEIHGIWMCFCHIYKERPALLESRIALITDTEYSRIKGWQNRSEPFFERQVLPEGIDIFYATSDAGGDEFTPNRLIRTCDQLSTKKMREILK